MVGFFPPENHPHKLSWTVFPNTTDIHSYLTLVFPVTSLLCEHSFLVNEIATITLVSRKQTRYCGGGWSRFLWHGGRQVMFWWCSGREAGFCNLWYLLLISLLTWWPRRWSWVLHFGMCGGVRCRWGEGTGLVLLLYFLYLNKYKCDDCRYLRWLNTRKWWWKWLVVAVLCIHVGCASLILFVAETVQAFKHWVCCGATSELILCFVKL